MVGLDGWSCSGILNPQKFKIDSCEMEKRRPQRRQPDDHNFGSFLMLAVTSRRVSAGGMGRAKGAFLSSFRSRRSVEACGGLARKQY
jgi:hypothetical protein